MRVFSMNSTRNLPAIEERRQSSCRLSVLIFEGGLLISDWQVAGQSDVHIGVTERPGLVETFRKAKLMYPAFVASNFR